MRRAAIAAIVWLAAGCGVASMPPPGDAARVDAGLDSGVHDAGADAFANDAGMDASDLDAGRDANDLDANDLDAGRDANDLDAGLDASDAWVSIDTNPPDANTVRTYDPPTSPSATPIAPFTTCTVTTASDTIFAGHLPPCSPLPYAYEPPSNGLHYWFWAAYRTYTTPVPWGFLVHDLEHGAVVLAYHCANDADCNPVRAEFASIIASQGVDPICSSRQRRRASSWCPIRTCPCRSQRSRGVTCTRRRVSILPRCARS